MTRSKSDATRSRQAWHLARRQHGVVTRGQLLELGFTREAIVHRRANGRLHAMWRGVYAVGWPLRPREAWWMGATLACGKGAALSHRSAGALWGIAREGPGRIEVSVRRRCELRRPGIRARGRPALAASDVVVRDGIPATRITLTLVDLATELDDHPLERAVNEADKRDLIDPEELRSALDDYAGVPGVKRLRALLDRHTFRLSDSALEVRFRAVAQRAGLPPPRTKAHVNGFEVDFFWPELGLVVETDGLRYHRTPAAQSRDNLRDQTHTAAGLTTLRFAHHQITREPTRVGSILRDTATRNRSK
jgi:very-short-patch-repair endonuclease